MIYLDYSATTPVDKEVLETFNIVTNEFIGNPNSLHKLGVKSKKLIDDATNQIARILKIKPNEIIYTSCASESNNQAIKGVVERYKNLGNQIITTELEHSSIYGPLTYLQKFGYEISFVKLDENGLVDIEDLKKLLKNNTCLVTISEVNSETGIKQDINYIGKIIKENSDAIFHVDITQSVGKISINLDNIDLASFAAHKFYGLKGISCLIKKEHIKLEALIHGGKSTTIYRSGTPSPALIASISKALRLAYIDIDKKYNHVENLNKYLRNNLNKYKNISINSNDYSIPHMLNISVLGIKPETFQHALEEFDIYISTQSACATGNKSTAVYAITQNEEKALSSLRISLSYLTTIEELNKFLQAFDIVYNKLNIKR